MLVNFSSGASRAVPVVGIERCARIATFSAKLISLIVLAAVATVETGFAKEDEINGRGSHLIDHKRVEAMRTHRHDQGSGQQVGFTGTISALQTQVTDLQGKVAALTSANVSMQSQLQAAQSLIGSLQTQVTALTNSAGGGAGLNALSKYITVDPNPINGIKGPHVIFTGVNVHIRSGSGFTDDGGSLRGLGNLIVGYNELPNPILVPDIGPCDRALTGSHNIVGGSGNVVGSYGGFVAGTRNCLTGAYTSVLGGNQNESSGPASTILGGFHFDTFNPNETVPVIR
jgi:hypothetical protein